MFNLNCPPDACRKNFQCDIEYKGRIIAFGGVKKTFANEIDNTDADTFQETFWLQVLLGNAFAVLNTAGDKPKPETAELPGSGMRISKPGAKTHTINFTDGQILGNIDFYNKLLRTSQNYDFYYYTPSLLWDVSGEQVTIIGDPVIQNELTQYIGGEGTVKWVSNGNPMATEFDTDVLLAGLFYEISGLDAFSVSGISPYTTNYTAELNYNFGSTSLPSLVWSLDGHAAEVAALTAAIDATTGELEINPGEAGIYVITVYVTNQYGCIFGTLDVTVTVTA